MTCAEFYTMEEVATGLHKSRRWLQDFLRDHPYYRMAGRTKLFSDGDVARIVEALPCPSNSSRRARTGRRTGRSGAPTSDNMLTEALRLAGGQLRERFSARPSGKSNVVPSPT